LVADFPHVLDSSYHSSWLGWMFCQAHVAYVLLFELVVRVSGSAPFATSAEL
jgi:hypothetical protein